MRVVCPGCSTGYRVADEKVSGDGARIKCPKCGTVFIARKQAVTATEKKEEPRADDGSSTHEEVSGLPAAGGDAMTAENVDKILKQQPAHEQATSLRQLLGLDEEGGQDEIAGRHSTDAVKPAGADSAPSAIHETGVDSEGTAGQARGVSAIRAQSKAVPKEVLKSYKVKTPRGLTYDFSSREAMLRWLSKRDDLDQCEVAEPGGDWIPAGSLLDFKQPVSTTGEILAHSPGVPAKNEPDTVAGHGSGEALLAPARSQRQSTAFLWGVNLLLLVLVVSAVVISLTRYGIVDLSSLPPASWLGIAFPNQTAASVASGEVASNHDRVYLRAMDNGRAALKAGQYSRAALEFNRALGVRRDSREAMKGLAEAFRAMGDDARASEIETRLRRLAP